MRNLISTKTIKLLLAACFVLLMVTGAKSQEIEYVGSLFFGGSFRSLHVTEQFAYCAMNRGFQILDITDPGSVTPVGGNPHIHPRELELSGNYVYVAAGTLEEPRFGVIDIQDPEDPIIIATLDAVGYWPMAMSGDYVYIINPSWGISIIDVSEPNNPEVLGTYLDAARYHDIFISGSYLYLSAGGSDLQIVDISNPVEPALVTRYVSPLGGGSWEVFVEQPYAYMKSGDGSIIEIVDISDPSNPSYMGHMDFALDIRGIFVEESLIYAFQYSGLDFAWTMIINAEDPENPYLEYGGSIIFEEWGHLLNMHAVGNIVYHTVNYWMTILDVSTPSSPTTIGSYKSTYALHKIEVSGDYAYGLHSDRVFVFDVSDRTNPELVSTYSLGAYEYARDIAVAGDYAYIAEIGVEIIDVSIPESPSFVGHYISEHKYCVAAQGDYIYVGGMDIIDVSNPADPTRVGHYGVGRSWDIFVKDSLAFIPKAQGDLVIVDISDPTEPVPLGSCETPGGSRNVHVQGQYAYVAVSESGILIIDVSDPNNPFQVAQYETPGSARDVYAKENHAFIADRDAGVIIIDISDPLNPLFVTAYDTPGLAESIDFDSQYIYVGDYFSLMILRFTGGPCEYIPGDCDHNGTPLEISDVITMIGNYRGSVEPYYDCNCGVDPPGPYFAATADPNGNCVANELNDVVTEIGAYRGSAEVSGCPDCPGSGR